MSYYQYCGHGYSKPVSKCSNYGNGFTLIVVLFILLIIVGATFYC